MSRMRKRTAERLVLSQQSTATLSTFNEVDMSKIIDLRKKISRTVYKKTRGEIGFYEFFRKGRGGGSERIP